MDLHNPQTLSKKVDFEALGPQLTDVMNCKAVIEHYASNRHQMCKLLSQEWQILRETVYILQIPLRATIAVQRHDLTLSDVFGIWKRMQLHLGACSRKTNYKTSLATFLLESLNTRKEAIYNNPFMTSAIFLDPSFRNQLASNGTKVEEAKRMLSNLWQRQNYAVEGARNANHSGSSNISFDFDADAELTSFLQGNNTEDDPIIHNNVDIDLILESFPPELLSPNHSILEYWDTVKNTHPQLYTLAMLVHSVPPTEVPIKRDFSHLNHVFSNRRGRLQSARLTDIMIMNLNKQVSYETKGDELRDAITQY
ncbi:zinc finger BED domain-containing protein 4-like [Sitodiplosis mosellana]|uniref:zinc finger BED domain-containing protein 4-like n=1 Tax=Sitodiplosis mosellana TaxID=263140 RepID=UPI0024448A5E|nr:zinc finger BED domain-containing protein 4-like [Sitodiplosis mosellana]